MLIFSHTKTKIKSKRQKSNNKHNTRLLIQIICGHIVKEKKKKNKRKVSDQLVIVF